MTAAARPHLALISSVACDGGIGHGNELLWRNSDDLKRFKRLTLGHPIVMGRRTWDSLGRPLPGRRNIVITRNDAWHAEGAERAASLADAIALCASADRVFVIGGAQIYAEALPLADELELTEIDATFEADAFFPAWDRARFTLVHSEAGSPGAVPAFRFATYQRQVQAGD